VKGEWSEALSVLGIFTRWTSVANFTLWPLYHLAKSRSRHGTTYETRVVKTVARNFNGLVLMFRIKRKKIIIPLTLIILRDIKATVFLHSEFKW